MQTLDISQNHRISRLTQLTRELDQSRTPEETFKTLLRAFFDVGGFIASLLLSTAGLPAGRYRVLHAQLGPEFEPGTHPTQAQPGAVCSGGIMATIIARPQPQVLNDVEWTRDPNFRQMLGGYSSVMAIPLVGNHLPMNWVILLKKPPERFSESDLEEAMERTALASALLENQLLAGELARAHEQIDLDAQRVGELQRALLPASLPRIAGLEIAASYEPSGRAGGDVYDFFPLDEPQNGRADMNGAANHWCVLIGDAPGHGLAAAVVMAIVQAVLHAHPSGIDGPAALLTYANRQLCARRVGGFFTAFLGVYNPSSRQLTYSIAGHPPPLLKRASDRSIRALNEVGSYPLGIDETETFNEANLQLEPGDTVLLYTDGITEAINLDKDLFGDDQLMRAFINGSGERPAQLIHRLRAALCAHVGSEPAIDDQTLVAALVL